MANYADAALDAAKYRVPALMNSAEMKVKPSTALMKYMENRDFLIPATERERVLNTKSSDQQSVEVHTMNKQSITTGSSRAAAHTGGKNDSRKQTIGFNTYSATFSYGIKSADRNIHSLADVIAAQMQSAIIALHESIETAALATFNANKSQVVQFAGEPRGGVWDETNHVFQVAASDLDYWVQRVQGFMRQNYYSGLLDAVVDDLTFQDFMRIANQGAGNASNLAFQLGNMIAAPSTELSVDAGYTHMGYAFPRGTIGLLDWIPSLNRAGYGDSGKVGGLYSSITDPLGSGLTFALHQYQSAADSNSTDGETQDITVQVELSVDLGFVQADASTSNESTIFKFGVTS